MYKECSLFVAAVGYSTDVYKRQLLVTSPLTVTVEPGNEELLTNELLSSKILQKTNVL